MLPRVRRHRVRLTPFRGQRLRDGHGPRRFAVDRDIIEADPTAAIRKAKIGGKDVERDRVLSEDEIRALHRQIPSAGLLNTTEAALWLTLATGCRIGEDKSHIDFDTVG